MDAKCIPAGNLTSALSCCRLGFSAERFQFLSCTYFKVYFCLEHPISCTSSKHCNHCEA